ncbi:MAG: M48 family metalloprotease [Bacteroidales bacterium]|nr:M48 family metalloprotease [Bacteroidales bacterium]
MKKLFTLTVLVVACISFFGTSLYAQQSYGLDLTVRTTGKIMNSPVLPGSELTIKSVLCDASARKGFNYILSAETPEGEQLAFDLSKVREMPIVCENPTKDEYWFYRSIQHSLPSLSHMANAYAIRTKAESEANEYVNNLRKQGLVLEDPMLTSYINSLLVKINPVQRLDFFKYNMKVVIVKSSELNAGIYPNGMLLINAAMLANLRTEDELVAVLCHEANHFICNHYLENLAKIQRRQNAGAVGSALLGVAAGIFLGSASVGLATASLGNEVATDINAVISAVGLAFDQTQEKESDRAAVELLPILGYDENAMATSIKRIGDYYLEEGNLEAYYSSGNHPKIEDRIAATGIPYDRTDATFEKKMASCISYLAQVKYEQGRYTEALALVTRNIENGIGRGIDYYLRGECLLNSFDSEETNTEAVEMLQKAKESYYDGISAIKALTVAQIRTGQVEEARNLLTELKESAGCSKDDRIWADNMLMNL